MKTLRSALDVLSKARRPYVILNIGYYGLVICSMAFTALNPSFHQALMAAVGESLSDGLLAPVVDAYSAERIVLATALTVGINVSVGSFATITLPSLILPFSGLLMAVVRAVLWGMLFAPRSVAGIGAGQVGAALLMAILVLLEGQGYVLASLGAYLHGRAFLRPRRVGLDSRRQGYSYGLKTQARIYALVVVVLLIAAVYEVLIAVYAIPVLLR